MKSLALGVILLMGSLALGVSSGKLMIEDGYYIGAGKVPPPTIGLGIYQSLGKGYAYNMWTGLGHQPRIQDETVRWLSSKHELLKHYGPITIGIGYAFKHAQKPEHIMPGQEIMLEISEHKIYGKLGLQLW